MSELVALQLRDVQSERMMLHVRHGKGGKDRYTLLSPRLLTELRDYWREHRPERWLFLNKDGTKPLPASTPATSTSPPKRAPASTTAAASIRCGTVLPPI